MRLPRVIRLDASDTRIFERAAEPGEWAVSGAFAFADAEPATLTGKRRPAFANGFLGTTSFGRATLVEVAEIDEASHADVIQRLALHFITDYGAPDLEAALPAARDEVAFADGADGIVNAEHIAREHGAAALADDSLEHLLEVMDAEQTEHLPVVDGTATRRVIGVVHRTDVLIAHNRALIADHHQ